MKLSKEKIKEYFNKDIDSDYARIDILSEDAYKTRKQNNLFHSLLSCFWESGCSSFISYNEMRMHYKHIAGLVEYKYQNNLTDWTKKCLWEAIKLLPLEKEELRKCTELLKGKVLIEHSWSEAKKSNTKRTIDEIINDMNMSAVTASKCGKRYESILKTLGEYYE